MRSMVTWIIADVSRLFLLYGVAAWVIGLLVGRWAERRRWVAHAADHDPAPRDLRAFPPDRYWVLSEEVYKRQFGFDNEPIYDHRTQWALESAVALIRREHAATVQELEKRVQLSDARVGEIESLRRRIERLRVALPQEVTDDDMDQGELVGT